MRNRGDLPLARVRGGSLSAARLFVSAREGSVALGQHHQWELVLQVGECARDSV